MSFDDEFDDFDEELEEPQSKTPAQDIKSKTPKEGGGGGGKKISLYFTSTIGPGEKKQKLVVDDGNRVSDIKQTVGNMFGLNPSEFHLSSGGVTMDEANPLGDYNVNDGDEVLLIPASTAG
ncbi:MAG: ubiquitin family protein [Candidatus Lokiarchaeota archaeon]